MKHKSLHLPGKPVLKQIKIKQFSPLFRLQEVTIINSTISSAKPQLSIKRKNLANNNFVRQEFFPQPQPKRRSPHRQADTKKFEIFSAQKKDGEKCKTIRPKDNPYLFEIYKANQKKCATEELVSRRSEKKQLLLQNHNINVIRSRNNSIQITESFGNILGTLNIKKVPRRKHISIKVETRVSTPDSIDFEQQAIELQRQIKQQMAVNVSSERPMTQS